MILDSYVQALLWLVKAGRITVDDIKSEDYHTEVQARLNAQ